MNVDGEPVGQGLTVQFLIVSGLTLLASGSRVTILSHRYCLRSKYIGSFDVCSDVYSIDHFHGLGVSVREEKFLCFRGRTRQQEKNAQRQGR